MFNLFRKTFDLLSLVILAGLSVSLSPSAHAEEGALTAVYLEQNEGEGSSGSLAVSWTGSKPVELVLGRFEDDGTFARRPTGQRLEESLSIVPDESYTRGDRVGVVDSEGRLVAHAPVDHHAYGWQSEFVGPGLNGRVQDMLVYQGELVVAGRFRGAGRQQASGIAKWDGAAWKPLGNDDGGSAPTFNGDIKALAEFDGELIIAGRFTEIEGRTINHIARWDGIEWQALGDEANNGVSGSDPESTTVHAMVVHDNALYVGGRFGSAGGVNASNVARWDGAAWTPVSGASGEGVTQSMGAPGPDVYEMSSYGGELIIGGRFDQAAGIPARNIARWSDGVWRDLPLDTGGDGTSAAVLAMGLWGSELVLGGEYLGRGVPQIWDGSSLRYFESVPNDTPSPKRIEDVISLGGDLIGIGVFGPAFPFMGDDISMARWTGDIWEPVDNSSGTDPDIGGSVMIVYGGNLVVGGEFSTIGDRCTNNLAIYDGTEWQTLEAGTGGGILSGTISDSVVWNDQLVVGGSFSCAGSKRVNHVARWDGWNWQSLGLNGPVGVSAEDGEANVSALAVHDGDLVVAGKFDHAGVLPARNIAKFDLQGWSSIDPPSRYTGRIYDVAVWNDQIVAPLVDPGEPGDFVGVFVSRFDGDSWVPMHLDEEEGFSRSVLALAGYGDDLYAGGFFSVVEGERLSNIARYDGQRWVPVNGDSQDVPDGAVQDLIEFQGELLIAGDFRNVDELDSPGVVRWDGQSWLAVEHGQRVPREVWSIADVNGQLYAAGRFDAFLSGYVHAARYYDGKWIPLGGPLAMDTNDRVWHVTDWRGLPLFSGAFDTAGGLPAEGLARFSLEPSSAEVVEVQPPDGGLSPWENKADVVVRVDGAVRRPTGGIVIVESSYGEDCLAPVGTPVEGSLEFECRIRYQSGGPRTLTASYSESPTHADSLSEPVQAEALWPTYIEITEVVPDSGHTAGQPFDVVVTLSGGGNPTGTIEVDAENEESCVITLPEDRCRLIYPEPGRILVDAQYWGDENNLASTTKTFLDLSPSGLRFSPFRLEFGSVGPGLDSDVLEVSVENNSGAAVDILAISPAEPPFHDVSGGTCLPLARRLSSGESCSLLYRFSPTESRSYLEEITIDSTADDGPHVYFLGGVGKDPIFWDGFRSAAQ